MLFLGGGTTLSYYVEALWFDSLGFSAVFWTSLNLRAWVFLGFAAITFLILYFVFLVLKPARLGELGGGTILVNGQPIRLPVEPVIRLIGIGVAAAIALITGLAMSSAWSTFALYWRGGLDRLGAAATAGGVDRSDLRAAAGLLPVHAAGLAAPRRLADDAERGVARRGAASSR